MAEIAAAAGFSHQSHMARRIRRAMGLAPRALRRRLTAATPPRSWTQLWKIAACPVRFLETLFTQEHFAAADELIVDPHSVLVAGRPRTGPGRTSQQAHPRRGLKNIRSERAAVHVKFHAQISRFAIPGDLVSGIEHDGFWENSD